MKRREALKNIGFATGFFVFTPTVLSMLQSCESDRKTWTPQFFTLEQGVVLTGIVDTILPKTDNLPSASDINVPEFIDKYVNEVMDSEAKEDIKIAFGHIISILKSNTTGPVEDFAQDDYKTLLDEHLKLNNEIDPQKLDNNEKLRLTNSDFLNQIKAMTIKAYLTTEQIGEEVLVYEPIPTKYYCGDLQELTGGKSYSL